MTDNSKTLEAQDNLKASAQELLANEYQRLLNLSESELSVEFEDNKQIVNFALNSHLDSNLIRFDKQFTQTLESILLRMKVLEIESAYLPTKNLESYSDRKPFSKLDYKIVKLLIYKSLLLPIYEEELPGVLLALCNVLKTRLDGQGVVEELISLIEEEFVNS